MHARYALLLFAFIFAVGCDSVTETAVLRAPGGATPVAGTIEWRDPNNFMLGVIGSGPLGHGYIGTRTPRAGGGTGGDAIPAEFALNSAYPNPTNGRATISFALPAASEVAVFVVAARPPGGQAPPRAGTEQSAWVFRPGGLPVAVLDRQPRSAGQHQVNLDFSDLAGRPVPDGYYRVYVQTPYVIAWTDVLLDSSLFPF